MVAIIAALLVFGGVLLVLSSKPAVMVGKRIAPHTEEKKQVVVVAPGQEMPKISMLHQLYVATEKIAGSFNYWKRITFRLEQANLPLRTAEVVYIQLAQRTAVRRDHQPGPRAGVDPDADRLLHRGARSRGCT